MKLSKRIYLEITVLWGNEDAIARIKVSRRRWSKILNGETYQTNSYSYYEGTRSIVQWCFENKELTIIGDAYQEYIIGLNVNELYTCLIGID